MGVFSLAFLVGSFQRGHCVVDSLLDLRAGS